MKLKKLVTAGIEGLARYTGMDQKGVYFRARHFPTESECICRCDKATGKVEVLSQLFLTGRIATIMWMSRAVRFTVSPRGRKPAW